jgi:hypothetical protein
VPTIFIINGFRFFFYSNENDEPMHEHVQKAECEGKVWLQPGLAIAYMHKFSSGEVQQIMEIVEKELLTLKKKWNEYFSK